VKAGGAKRLSVSLCALLVAGFLVPTLAAAAWTTPVNLSASGLEASQPQVAVDADGDAVFTWTRYDGANLRVQARTRSAAGTLSPVLTLSKSGQNAENPQVAVDAGGDAVFVWRRYDGANYRVQTRARSAAGTLSPVQTLSSSGQIAANPHVAVDADGDAVFTWQRFDGTDPGNFCCFRVQARARSVAGTLSGVQTLSVAGQNASNPQVAVDADGDAVFTWDRWDATSSTCCERIQARARSAAGTLSPVQTLSKSGQSATNQQVAVDADGDAVFSWQRFDGTNPFGLPPCCYRVQTRARSAAGTLSAVQTLSGLGRNGFGPQVAVDADGDAVFTWGSFDGATLRVQARARSAAGTLSAVQNLSDPGQNVSDTQVAVDADGDAVFAWVRSDGANDRVQARARSAAGTLSPVQTLSKSGQNAALPQVAVDTTGDAVATWRRFDGTAQRIQASAGP
jgi:hypothetical protein